MPRFKTAPLRAAAALRGLGRPKALPKTRFKAAHLTRRSARFKTASPGQAGPRRPHDAHAAV